MKLVEEEKNIFYLTEFRKYKDVKKGFTPFTDGDVIFAKITPCMENGKCAILRDLKNGIGFGSTEFHVSRARECVIAKYIFYFIIQQHFRRIAESNMTGSVGQKRVPTLFFSEFEIPLPPHPEQHRIVSKIEELFSELDKGVESLKTARQQLKIYRQAVLKWAFEGRLTHENVKDGELPEEWRWVMVKDIALDIQYGYTESSSKEKVGPKFLRITDIQENKVDWSKVPYCKIPEEDLQKKKLQDGDLVFARTVATVGKSFLIKGEIPDAVFASYLIRLRFSKDISDKYVLNFFQSHSYWQQIVEGQVGIGQPNVNGTKLGQLILPLPTLPEQHKIVQEIETRLSVCDKLGETITTALQQSESLRQSILKKAFEGKLVEQDPKDEPASKLLKRIKVEKAAVQQNIYRKGEPSTKQRYKIK